MLRCYGDGCPFKDDCYRYTQPSPGRDAFGVLPYDARSGTCGYFLSNLPTEEQVRTTAYYMWLRDGCPEQRADQHWQEAYLSWCRSLGRVRG